jgi:hypothetical protein
LKNGSWRIHEHERPEIDESLGAFSFRSRANEQGARDITVLMFRGNEEVERGTRGIGANKQHARDITVLGVGKRHTGDRRWCEESVWRLSAVVSWSRRPRRPTTLPSPRFQFFVYPRLHGGPSPRGGKGMWSVSGHFIGGYNEVNSGGDRKTSGSSRRKASVTAYEVTGVNSGGEKRTPYSSVLCRLATITQRSRSIVNCRL